MLYSLYSHLYTCFPTDLEVLSRIPILSFTSFIKSEHKAVSCKCIVYNRLRVQPQKIFFSGPTTKAFRPIRYCTLVVRPLKNNFFSASLIKYTKGHKNISFKDLVIKV